MPAGPTPVFSGTSFPASIMADRGYLDPIEIVGLGLTYPVWQAFLVAAAADLLRTLQTTSVTSLTVSVSSKTLVLAVDTPFTAGSYVTISMIGSPGNVMHGQVTSYTAATRSLIVNVTTIEGSGSSTSWNVAISGPRGGAGAGLAALVNDPAPTLGANMDAAFKRITNAVLRQPQFEINTINIVAPGTATLDPDLGPYYVINMAAATTIAFLNPSEGRLTQFFVKLVQDATGGHSLTLPATVHAQGGVQPTLPTTANTVSFVNFWTDANGSIWNMAVIASDMKLIP